MSRGLMGRNEGVVGEYGGSGHKVCNISMFAKDVPQLSHVTTPSRPYSVSI